MHVWIRLSGPGHQWQEPIFWLETLLETTVDFKGFDRLCSISDSKFITKKTKKLGNLHKPVRVFQDYNLLNESFLLAHANSMCACWYIAFKKLCHTQGRIQGVCLAVMTDPFVPQVGYSALKLMMKYETLYVSNAAGLEEATAFISLLKLHSTIRNQQRPCLV